VNPGAAEPVNPDADPVNPVAADPVNLAAAAPVIPDADPVNPDEDPVKAGAADPVKAGAADPVKPAAEPVNPDADPVNPDEDPVKAGAADPVNPDPPGPPAAVPSGAGMNPAGSSCGSAASWVSAAPPAAAATPAVTSAPAGTAFLAAPLPAFALPAFALPAFAAFALAAFAFAGDGFLAWPGLRTGIWAAARTSARRADRACRRRQALAPKMSPSSSRKTRPAMIASSIRVPRMFRWIGPLCTAGGLGAAWPEPVLEAAEPGTASVMAAAATRALAASTVPYPEPTARPPCRRYTVLEVIAWVTCAGVSWGNCARMSAAMPATIALAALVL